MPILTAEDRLGTLFAGRYQLDRILGTGGTGVVYEAKHSWTGRKVAVKLLQPHLAQDVSLVRRFLQEARSASEVPHPNVVQIFDCGAEDDGTVFLVMEKLHGESLDERLHDVGTLDLRECLRVLVPIMDALVLSHARGIVHRDLKPANLFLHTAVADQPITPKLLDFGMSKILDSEWGRATQTGTVVGTPYYMSPEQAEGLTDLDGRSDVWSLGVVFYRCLSGRLPFTGSSAPALLLSIVRDKARSIGELLPELPRGVVRVLDRALESDRDARWPTMRAFLEALADACERAEVAFPRLPSDDPMPARAAFEPGPRRKRRRWPAMTALGAVVVAVGVGAFFAATRLPSERVASPVDAREEARPEPVETGVAEVLPLRPEPPDPAPRAEVTNTASSVATVPVPSRPRGPREAPVTRPEVTPESEEEAPVRRGGLPELSREW